ncbi:4-hydroxy-tetrahydrodipicolinate synthase [uncultured Cocleimonas sp.]|uniref:4-hydroxy-tetrahydrodipicolinate synthase n=1 Tax=uncultured Cocleimonas sp. TaxID=1051587 RepID=UPI00262ED3D8|nr:4-hydroxy-tetrahydrodipicolinate synthase [uncultured Cocleimonas sp.]
MFQGSMVALATPMTTTGDLDESALEALVGFHLDAGTDAIVAMGTTAESATFSHKEHRAAVKMIIALVAGKIPVIAGTGSNSTVEALELTKAAKEDGADAVLLVTPYYNKPPQEGLFQHHKLIAEKVAIPQLLYNVPGRTSVDMLPETVERLSDISNIVAIKEATGDLDRAKEIIKRCGDRIDVISGDDGTAMELILAGGKGDISVTANVAPALMHQMCKAALAGDRKAAEEINNKLIPLHTKLFVEANPIPVKWLLHKMGYGSNTMRLPLVPLSEEFYPEVTAAAAVAGIEI